MQEGKLSGYRWIILFLSSFLIFSIDYVQFQISGLAYLIMPALNLDVAQFSALLMAPMLVGAILSVPAGALADRYGSKIVVTVAAAIALAGTIGRMFAGDFITMLVMMLGTGFLGCAVQTVTIKLYGAWFEDKLDFAMGVFFACACAGIGLGLATSPMFPDVNSAYIFSDVMTAVALVLWILFARNTPAGMSLPEPEPVIKNLGVVARNKYVWLVGIIVGLGLGTATNYSGILPQALIDVRGVDPTLAGTMAAVIQFVGIAGSIIGPIMCRKNPRLMCAFIAVFGGFIMIANWFVPLGPIMWIILIINGIFSVASGPVIQAMPFSLDGVGFKYAGAAGGLVGMVSLVISYFLPILIGVIAGPDYTVNFILEGVFYAAAAIPLLMLPKNVGKVDETELVAESVM